MIVQHVILNARLCSNSKVIDNWNYLSSQNYGRFAFRSMGTSAL